MNRITVFIDAVDKLTPKLQGIDGAAQGLGAGAVFLGNLYTKAFDVATAAVGSFIDQFQEASNLQTQSISLAGQFAGMTGQSFDEATAMLRNLNNEFAVMAGALPGATQDYKDLGMAISDTLIGANTKDGVFNQQGFESQAESLAQSLGLLMQSSEDLHVSDVQRFFGRFVEGASQSELSILKMAETMPGLMGQLQKAANELKGGEVDLAELTKAERVKVFQMASEGLTPPEMIEALKGTASSQIESLKTAIFDQNTGLFGALRDVYQDVEGDQSVIVAAGKALQSVLGEGGLLDTVGQTLEDLGISGFDPMRILYDGLMGFSEMVNDISGDSFALDPRKLFDGLGEKVSEMLNQGLDSASNFLNNTFTADAAASIGVALGNLVNAGVDNIGAYLSNTDWSQLGSVAVTVALRITQLLGSLLLSIDWLGIVTNLVKGFLAIREAIGGVQVRVREEIYSGMRQLASMAADWTKQKITELLDTVKSTITGLFDGIKDAVSTAASWRPSLPSLPSLPSFSLPSFGGEKQAGHAASGLNFSGLFSAISNELSQMPAQAGLVVANSSEAILNQEQQGSLIGMVRSAVQSRPLQAVSSAVQRTAQRHLGTFAPVMHIHALPGMDANQVAELALQKLDERYRQYTEGLL